MNIKILQNHATQYNQSFLVALFPLVGMFELKLPCICSNKSFGG